MLIGIPAATAPVLAQACARQRPYRAGHVLTDLKNLDALNPRDEEMQRG